MILNPDSSRLSNSAVACSPTPISAPLVPEDDAVNQTVVLRMLARLGVRADVAGNGREAIEMIRYAALRCRIHGLPDARDGPVRSNRGNSTS